jgi:hypothetical protein
VEFIEGFRDWFYRHQKKIPSRNRRLAEVALTAIPAFAPVGRLFEGLVEGVVLVDGDCVVDPAILEDAGVAVAGVELPELVCDALPTTGLIITKDGEFELPASVPFSFVY